MSNQQRLKDREKQRRLRIKKLRKNGATYSPDQKRQYAANRANLLMAGDLLAALQGISSMPAAKDMLQVIIRGGVFRKKLNEVIDRDLSHAIQWLQTFQQERINAKN